MPPGSVFPPSGIETYQLTISSPFVFGEDRVLRNAFGESREKVGLGAHTAKVKMFDIKKPNLIYFMEIQLIETEMVYNVI